MRNVSETEKKQLRCYIDEYNRLIERNIYDKQEKLVKKIKSLLLRLVAQNKKNLEAIEDNERIN